MSRDECVAGYTIVVNNEGVIFVTALTSITDIAGLGQNLRHPRDPEVYNSVQSALADLEDMLSDAIKPYDEDGNELSL